MAASCSSFASTKARSRFTGFLKAGAAERVGTLPYYRAEFSISSDGKHVAAFGYNDKTDIYMIRNFGKMLRR
jgi:hypothetical protein